MTDGTGRGLATRWEDGWGIGDEGSSSGELNGTSRGEAPRREVRRGDGVEVNGAE